MLFLYELKKLYKNKVFISLLILFSLLNILCIYDTCKDYISDDVYQTELSLTDKFEGTLTKEKVDTISENYIRLSDIINSNSYSTEYDNSTYTGYQMMDYNVFSKLNNEIYRIYNLKETTKETLDSINSSADFFKNCNNINQYNKYQKLANSITDRNITEIHNYTGVNEYINYNLSILFILVITIFISVFEFSSDKEMIDIIYTSSNSKKNIFKVKIASLLFNITIITIIFSILDLLTFKILIGNRGIFSPLFYLEQFSTTFFNGSIFSFAIINIIVKIICLIVISLFACCITIIIKKSNYSMIVSILALAFLLSTSNNIYNPLNLIYINQDFISPIFFCNLPLAYIKILIWFIVSIILIVLVYLIQKGIIKNGNIKV